MVDLSQWTPVAVSAISADASNAGRKAVIAAPGGAGLRDFVSVKDATGTTPGAVMDGAADDGPSVRALYNGMMSAGGRGLMYVPEGTLFANTTGQGALLPLTRSNDPTSPMKAWRLQGSGIDSTTIKLSANTPRLTDFNKVADGDSFNNWAVWDLTVDGNNVGGQHHVIAGTYQAGVQQTKINVSSWSVRRVRTINVPSDPTTVNHRLNLWVYVQCNLADAACTITDVVVEDLDLNGSTHTANVGGNYGVGIGGTTNDGNGNGNLTHDRIYLTRVNHDTGQINTGAAYSSCCIQVGSKDLGLTVTVRDCHSWGAGDLGIGLLNSRHGHCEDCTVTDARTLAFQAANFNPNLPVDQQHTFRSCHVRLVSLNPIAGGAYPAQGFGGAGSPTQQLGTLTLDNCSWYSLGTNCPPPGTAITVTVPLRSLQVSGEFRMTATSVNHSLAGNYVGGLIQFTPPGAATFSVRGALRSSVSGSITLNAHTFAFNEVSIPGLTSSSYVLDVDAHCVNYGLTGVPANSFIGCLIGPSSVLTSPIPAFKGNYRIVIESHTSADTGPRGILTQPAYSAAPQIQINGVLKFPNCDFSAFPAGSVGQEIVIDSAQTFADVSLLGAVVTVLIFYPGIVPANGGVMPLSSGFSIGALTGSVMNLSGVRRKYFFTGNMPTAVTFQRRSNTSATALAVATQAVYELEPGDRLNLTFAGTTGNTYQRIPAVV